MLRSKRVAAAAAALALLGATAVALAGGDGGPRTDRVEAAITFTHAQFRERLCDGPEGAFVEQHAVVDGTATGYVAGEVTMKVSVLFGIDTGEGFEEGTLVIRDPTTGRKVLDARFANGDIDEISQGALVGDIRGGGSQDDVGSGDLFASWRITFNEDGSITAQIGGDAADGRLPAVATSGKCTGPFESGEGDIPPPGSTAATSSALHRRWASSR
jgi:hypothetical protein